MQEPPHADSQWPAELEGYSYFRASTANAWVYEGSIETGHRAEDALPCNKRQAMRIVFWRDMSAAAESGYIATANLACRFDGDFADGFGDEVMFPGGFFGGDGDDDGSDDEEMTPDDTMQASRNPQEPEASPARSPESRAA